MSSRRMRTWGSSPLARGAPGAVAAPPGVQGLIPARAGSTLRQGRRGMGGAAHPRSRGEHTVLPLTDGVLTGSSPLARGARADPPPRRHPARLIPARAGSTTHDAPRQIGDRGSSPLARGAHVRELEDVALDRLIPARAGSTLASQRTCQPSWAHPRSRGEHMSAYLLGPLGGGSSPLARGAPCGDTSRAQVRGLIPARAGSTA